MSIPGIPQLSQNNLIMKASALPVLPDNSGAVNTGNTGTTGTSTVTSDQLLYDAFNSILGGGTTTGGFQTDPSTGLRPEDLAYAQSLYSSNPLDAYQSVSSYLTLGNFLPGLAGTTSAEPTTQDPGSFTSYKASFLGSISPQNAVDLANLLAGPILQ